MRKLTLADNTFDLIVDKGAMDALVCASPAEAQKGAQELWRVLKVAVITTRVRVALTACAICRRSANRL